MKRNFTFVLSTIAFAFVLVTPRAASASTISFDAVLTPPCAVCLAPGFYNGTGNPDGGFTLAADNGIELALRAKYRENPAPIHSATNLYAVVAGAQTVATTGGLGGANPTRAAWNWEVDVNLRPNGVGSLTLSQVSVFLTIDDLTALTSTGPFSMFAIPDNATWGAAGEHLTTAAGLAAGDWGAENSENPVFVGAAPAGFNMNDAHYYRVSISAFINGQPLQLLAENFIDISVGGATIPTAVPEPGTMILLGSGLIALASRRRKTVKSA